MSDRVPTAVSGFVIHKLSHSHHLDLLEDFLSISRRRRSNGVILAKLQLWMLEEIINDENAIKGLKKLADEKGLKRDRIQPPTDDDKATRVEAAINNGLQFHRAHANCIRQIGDAIAWRSFGYDRAVMRLLSQRSTKQQVIAAGTAYELQQWAQALDRRQGVPILNALTNVLAIGDITVVNPDGSGEIIEVKASKTKSRRLTRQKKQMGEVVKLLNFGRGEVENKEIMILRFDIQPENDLNPLLQLLDQAGTEGWSTGKPNPCCYVECINSVALRNSKQSILHFEESRNIEVAPWISRGDYVVSMSSLDVLAFTPNCAPFSIFPFPAKRCVELMTGTTAYMSYFNVSAFLRELENSGWKVRRSPNQIATGADGISLADAIVEVEREGSRMTVSPGHVTRMQMEMLRPGVIVRQLDALQKLGPRNTPRWSFGLYDHEPEIWD